MTSARNPHGYMLAELLVSAAIICAMVGTLLRFCAVAQSSVRTHGERADLQQRLRVAVEALRRDLQDAGAGPSRGASRGSLVDSFAPILPARSGLRGADPEMSYHPDRVSIAYVPAESPQTALVASMPSPAGPLRIDGSAPGCPPGALCGFSLGDRVLIHAPAEGSGSYDLFTVAAADGVQGLLTPAAPLSRTYPANSRVAMITQRVYYLDRRGRRLMVYDGDRSDVPLIDHVVDLRFALFADPSPTSITPPPAGDAKCGYRAGVPPVPLVQDFGGSALVALTREQLTDGPACGTSPRRFDADLLRVRRVRVWLRLEAEGAEFRGPGLAFANPGNSMSADRYIPDLQITFDVAPRNLLNTGLR